jgi:hypothetical protein
MTENKIVDLHDAEHTGRFQVGPLAQKKAIVEARQVKETEHLDTILANGFLETSREVPVGHWIITNPGGEEYAMNDEKFQSRYEDMGNGKFRAVGVIRCYNNPTGGNVEITAPWGEKQFGDSRCYFATAVDENYEPTKDRYIIGADEFDETYVWAQELNILVQLLQVTGQIPKPKSE